MTLIASNRLENSLGLASRLQLWGSAREMPLPVWQKLLHDLRNQFMGVKDIFPMSHLLGLELRSAAFQPQKKLYLAADRPAVSPSAHAYEPKLKAGRFQDPRSCRISFLSLGSCCSALAPFAQVSWSISSGDARWCPFQHKEPLVLWSTQSATGVWYAAQRRACLPDCSAI